MHCPLTDLATTSTHSARTKAYVEPDMSHNVRCISKESSLEMHMIWTCARLLWVPDQQHCTRWSLTLQRQDALVQHECEAGSSVSAGSNPSMHRQCFCHWCWLGPHGLLLLRHQQQGCGRYTGMHDSCKARKGTSSYGCRQHANFLADVRVPHTRSIGASAASCACALTERLT